MTALGVEAVDFFETPLSALVTFPSSALHRHALQLHIDRIYTVIKVSSPLPLPHPHKYGPASGSSFFGGLALSPKDGPERQDRESSSLKQLATVDQALSPTDSRRLSTTMNDFNTSAYRYKKTLPHNAWTSLSVHGIDMGQMGSRDTSTATATPWVIYSSLLQGGVTWTSSVNSAWLAHGPHWIYPGVVDLHQSLDLGWHRPKSPNSGPY